MPTCPQLHQTLPGSALPFERDLLCIKCIYTWKHLQRGWRAARPRRHKAAAACRILIGPPPRLMAPFDVARWGQSPERCRVLWPPAPPPPSHTHTHSPRPSLAPCSAEETETEFTFSSCGWFHCLPDCVRHISVYCPFLLWNEVPLLASFSLYLSLFFLPHNTTLCETAAQWLSAWKEPGMWNEAFVKLTLNLGEKKRNLLLFTLHPCWKCCALLLSSLLLILYEVNESHRELDHCHTYKFSVQNLMVLFKHWSQEGSRRKHKFLDALSLSKKKKNIFGKTLSWLS